MEKTIKIEGTPKEVAELLFNLDNREVAQVFTHWKRLFDENYEAGKAKGKIPYIFDLNHFMLYVVDEMDEEAKDIVRCMYSNLVYRMVDDIHKKHLLELQ